MFNNILIFLAGLKSSSLELTFSLQKSSSFLTCRLIFNQLLKCNNKYKNNSMSFYIYTYAHIYQYISQLEMKK